MSAVNKLLLTLALTRSQRLKRAFLRYVRRLTASDTDIVLIAFGTGVTVLWLTHSFA